ncbi:MAG: site-2 protease family protein [Candidatus Dormibacteria bacterium]
MSTPGEYTSPPAEQPFASGPVADADIQPWQHGHFQDTEAGRVDVPLEKVPNKRGRVGAGGAAGLGVLLLKYVAALKFVIPTLFKFKLLLSLVLNIGVYAILFGTRLGFAYGVAFGTGFVLLLLVHESGHLIAARMEGLNVSLPYFIPGMGALIMLKEQPRDARSEAIIAMGGPIAGTLGALAVLGAGMMVQDPNLQLFFGSLAGYGFFLNLINMVPVTPLDGGRIIGAVSRWLNLVGLVVLAGLVFSGLISSFFILIFLLIGGASAIARLRKPSNPRYFMISATSKAVIGIVYLGLVAVLVFGMNATSAFLETSRL